MQPLDEEYKPEDEILKFLMTLKFVLTLRKSKNQTNKRTKKIEMEKLKIQGIIDEESTRGGGKICMCKWFSSQKKEPKSLL